MWLMYAEERDAAAAVQAAREAAAEGRLAEHLAERREVAARERASGHSNGFSISPEQLGYPATDSIPVPVSNPC